MYERLGMSMHVDNIAVTYTLNKMSNWSPYIFETRSNRSLNIHMSL